MNSYYGKFMIPIFWLYYWLESNVVVYVFMMVCGVAAVHVVVSSKRASS